MFADGRYRSQSIMLRNAATMHPCASRTVSDEIRWSGCGRAIFDSE